MSNMWTPAGSTTSNNWSTSGGTPSSATNSSQQSWNYPSTGSAGTGMMLPPTGTGSSGSQYAAYNQRSPAAAALASPNHQFLGLNGNPAGKNEYIIDKLSRTTDIYDL